MPQVFVDTVAGIARINGRDALHARVRQAFRSLLQRRAGLVTTQFVWMEVADALANPAFRGQTWRFLTGWRQRPYLRIVPASSSLFDEAMNLYSQRLDKEWSLTDCTSFVVMTQEGITEAFTSDHHFEQAGFAKLL